MTLPVGCGDDSAMASQTRLISFSIKDHFLGWIDLKSINDSSKLSDKKLIGEQCAAKWKFLPAKSLCETMECIYYCGEKSDSSWAMTGGDAWRFLLFPGLSRHRSIYCFTQVFCGALGAKMRPKGFMETFSGKSWTLPVRCTWGWRPVLTHWSSNN